MRKRRFVVAGVAAAAMAMAFSSVAHAITFQSQQLAVTPSAGKLDKKKPGPLNKLLVDVITNYDTTVGGPPDRYATNTKVYFSKDFFFKTKGLAQCDPSTPGFATGSAANAIAVCGRSQVSSAGSATLEGPIPGVTAVVTAFNGTQPAGLPTILLHSQSSAGPSLVLTGTLRPSDTAGFGRMLDVPVDLGPFQGTEAITDFRVTIKKVKLPGKVTKKKPAQFFVMAKCAKKKWNSRAVTTYNSGSPTTANTRDKCRQK
jgi:hypothetical protein